MSMPKTQSGGQTADDSLLVTENRMVTPFTEVRLKDYGSLTLVQGDQYLVSIETHPRLLPRLRAEAADGCLNLGFGSWLDKLGEAFTTSLTRKPIRYVVTMPRLDTLTVHALSRVRVGAWSADHLKLELCGAVDARIDNLRADWLEVELKGIGQIAVTGQVAHQTLTANGPGRYLAGGLRSQRAEVSLSGAGTADLWVTDQLDVTIHGMGEVAYHGSPTVRQHIAGLGGLRRLPEPARPPEHNQEVKS